MPDTMHPNNRPTLPVSCFGNVPKYCWLRRLEGTKGGEEGRGQVWEYGFDWRLYDFFSIGMDLLSNPA